MNCSLQQLITTQPRAQHPIPLQQTEISNIPTMEIDTQGTQYVTTNDRIDISQHYKTYKCKYKIM